MKRAFDIIVGTILAVLAIPVILILALAMAATLRAWPFFVQKRIGRFGKEFWFPKIRTLPPDMPEYASKYEFGDDQIVRLGRFLRRSHLDELPQLLLVPFGTMSLVGPRPKMPDATEPIASAYGELRVQVRQGCTGLWQIGAHAHRQVSESPRYDLFYLRFGSLRFDLWILWRTAIGFLGSPDVHLHQVPKWVRGSGFLAAHEMASAIDLTLADALRVPAVAGR